MNATSSKNVPGDAVKVGMMVGAQAVEPIEETELAPLPTENDLERNSNIGTPKREAHSDEWPRKGDPTEKEGKGEGKKKKKKKKKERKKKRKGTSDNNAKSNEMHAYVQATLAELKKHTHEICRSNMDGFSNIP